MEEILIALIMFLSIFISNYFTFVTVFVSLLAISIKIFKLDTRLFYERLFAIVMIIYSFGVIGYKVYLI